MDDLISKQVAVEEVHHAIYEFFDFVEDDDESPITYEDKKLLELNKAITSRLKKLPPADTDYSEFTDKLYKKAYERGKAEVQRWIPVSERLPDRHVLVLVYSKLFGFCIDYINNMGEWYGTPKVLAWMPLPEPWKGGDA